MSPPSAEHRHGPATSDAVRTVGHGASGPAPAGGTASIGGTASAGEPASAGDPRRVLDRIQSRGHASSRYRLQGEIARGGMGAILEVFDEDLRRRLAMKVILDHETGRPGSKASSVHPGMLARFLEEAQVTGQLDHPGIVPVHELGLDAEGQVYFTMRLVQGRNLEAIFDLAAREQEGWNRTRAVGVLLKVCEAMAYAHSKGVVHRDLKPGNVMVGRFGEVYVMDWGLARVVGGASSRTAGEAPGPEDTRVATDRRDSRDSGAGAVLRTLDGSVVGTPSYMSPEQARGDVDGLDARSDVYAVGAMLYRLLAGSAPYVPARESGKETPKASALVLRVLDGPPAPLEALAPEAPAELVAVCARAMAREREARYADMQSLADDLRAFLEGRVVQAFEAGAWAEARKWMRRNRALSAALAGLALALVGGLGASLVFARRARDNAELADTKRLEADANAARARRDAAIARNANAFLNEDLLAAVAPEVGGIDVTVRDVLDQAGPRLEGRFREEPAVEAALRVTLGTSYRKLGDFDKSLAQFQRALELYRAAAASEAGANQAEALNAEAELARAEGELGRYAESLARYERVLAQARELHGRESVAALSIESDMALVLSDSGRPSEARTILEALLPIEERVLGPEHEATLSSANNLALLEQVAGELEPAERRLRAVLETRRRAFGPEHPETLNVASNHARVLADLGRFGEAVSEARALLEARKRVLGETHPQVAIEYGNLGTFLYREGRPADAVEAYQAALDLCLSRLGSDHPTTLTARHNLAASILEIGRTAEALELENVVLELRRARFGSDDLQTLLSQNTVAIALQRLRRLDEAERVMLDLLERRKRIQGENHPDTLIAKENLGGLLYAAGRSRESEELVREVLDGRTEVLGPDHPDTAKTLFNLAMVLKGQGRNDEALETATAAGEALLAALGPKSPLLSNTWQLEGDLLVARNEYDAALERYGRALEIQRGPDGDEASASYLLHQMGFAELGANRPARAVERLTEAAEIRERVLGAESGATRVTRLALARALLEADRAAEAEPLALELVERSKRASPPDDAVLTRTRALLVRIYERLGRPADADLWR